MLSKSWIDRSSQVESPSVRAVNLQVRTGVSAPFEPHMTGDDPLRPESSASPVSLPAATFMVAEPG